MNKKQSLLRYLSVALCSLFVSISAYAAIDFSGVTALADRLGGTALTSKVSFTEWEGQSGDKAQIIPGNGAFTIKATSVRAASYALGKYLRDVAKGHVSWCGNRAPQDWVIPSETIDATPQYEFTVAYNYCTLAYTMAFWGETEWRQEIDRLALLGFNVALVEAGLPRVWQLTLAEMGFSDEQIKKFIPDEAAQPWWNMGNLEGLGGPLSDARIAADADLGKFIATEMRKVGIEPILQGFVGLVPTFTAQVLDSTYSGTDNYEYVHQGYWCQGVERPILLSPRSQAFRDFAAKWYKNLESVYGFKPKYLGGDLFHEGGKAGSLDVPACATAVQTAQQTAIPGVTWVLQSWQGSPEQGVQNGVDPRYTLVEALDMDMSNTGALNTGYKRNYKNETTGEYLPWVWVEVMNFGGNTGMYGGMKRYSNIGTVSTASGIDAGSTAVFKGYGNLSEGFETNPTVYDLYMSSFMREKSAATLAEADRPAWFRAYQERRWGYTDDTLVAAYGTLATTVWQSHTYNVWKQQGVIENILCASPSYGATKTSQWGPAYTTLPYEPTDLMPVAQTFLETMEAHPELLELETFRYDMVEFFAQLLADRARVILKDCVNSGSKRAEFLNLIDLSEKILACSNGFRLDAKENRTKSVASDTGVAAYRRMVTTWMGSYDRGQATQLHEYAHRAYAGLMKDYYKKRWEAFFKSQTGEITSAAYVNTLKSLDETFPTATLTPTANGNLKEIAAEIVDFLTPQSLTWNGAADNTFEGANWTNVKGETVAWEDGKSVVLTGVDKTIVTQNPVTIGNVELTTDMTSAANVYGGTNGGYVTTDTDLGWTGLTLDDLASAKYTGIMSGAWMGGEKLDCSAYHIKKDGDSVTMQFQVVHDSKGVYVKVVAVKLSINAQGHVIANYLWSKNGNPETLGTEYTSSWSSANGDPNGYQGDVPKYGMIGISRFPASSVTVTGPVSITGEVTLNLGEAVSFPGATMIDTMVLENGNATLVLGADQELTINGVNALNGSKLVLKGAAATLQGASGAAKVKLPKSALANVVYVGPDGEEQALMLDAEGYAKMKLGTLTYDAFLTATATKTTWKNVTLDDLAACEFTACMTGGYFGNKEGGVIVSYSHVASRGAIITKTASSLTLQMQCVHDGWLKVVPLTFTIGADGFVYVQAATGGALSGGAFGTSVTTGTTPLATAADNDGYGIHELVVKPAVASISDIKSNYSSLVDAVADAGDGKKITLVSDTDVTRVLEPSNKVWIEIPSGITLTSEVNYFLLWSKSYRLDVYGVLDLQNMGFYFNNAFERYGSWTQELNVFAGAEIYSTHAKGIAVWGESTINFKQNAGYDTVVLNTAIQRRHNVDLNVEDGVTVEWNGNVVDRYSSETGIDNAVVSKSGDGTLVMNGSIADSVTMVLNAGTLTRALAPNETFTMTVNGGTPNIVPTDEDYEIIPSADGNVHTYTSTAIPWVAGVGEERVDTGWVKYRTYKEALAVVKEGQCVYVLDETCIPEGTEITSGPAGSYLTVKDGYMVDAEGNVIVIPRTFNLSAFGINWWDTDDSGSIYVGPAAKGGDAKWDVAANWMKTTKNGVGDRRTGGANDNAPYALGNPYNYALIDGNNIENVTPDGDGVYHLTADKLDFWRVRLGLTNKVDVTINEVTKMQKSGDTYIRVDPTSKLTIKKVTNNKGEEIDLHSAAPEGIVFEGMNGNIWNFYLEGEGTVQFNCQLSGSNHKVKHAEVDLGEGDGKYVKSKKLVGFASLASGANVTLADDAVKAADGTTMKSSEVSATAEVGTCAIRQGDDGFYLDFVARRSLYNEWRPIEDNNWSTAANWSWGTVPEKGDSVILHGGENAAVDIHCPQRGTAIVNELKVAGVIRLNDYWLSVNKLVSADEIRIASNGQINFQSHLSSGGYVGISGTAKIVFEDNESVIKNIGWPAIGGTVTVVVEEGVEASFFNNGWLYGSANGKVIKQGFGTLKFGNTFGNSGRTEEDWLGNLEIQEGIVEINDGCVENVYGDGKLKATTAKATNLTIKSLKAIMMVDMGTHSDVTYPCTLSTITMGDGADLDLTCSDKCCLTYTVDSDKHPVVSSGAWGFLGTVSGDTGTWDYSAVTIGDSDLKTSATTKTRTIDTQGFKYTLGTRHDEVKISIVVDLKADNNGKMLISVGYAAQAGAPSNFANLMYTTDGKLLLTHTQNSTTGSNTGATEVISGKHLVTMVCSKTNGTKLLVDGVQKATDSDITWGTKTQAPCGIIRFGSWADSGVHQGTEKATWYHATGTRYYSACIDCAGESGSASATAEFRLPAAFSKVSELEKAQLTLEYLNGSNGRVEVPGAYSIEGKSVITDIAKIAEMETLLGKNTGSKVTDLSMPFVPAEQTGDADSVSIAVNLSADLKGGKLVLVTSTTPNGEMTEVEGQVKTTPKAGTQTFTLDSITDSMGEGKVLYFKVKAEANK